MTAMRQKHISKKYCSHIIVKIIEQAIKDCADFNFHDFILTMVSAIPTYNGFSDADAFTSFFISHLNDIDMDTIKEVLMIYNGNGQCIRRGHHDADMAEINQYIQTHQAEDTSEE